MDGAGRAMTGAGARTSLAGFITAASGATTMGSDGADGEPIVSGGTDAVANDETSGAVAALAATGVDVVLGAAAPPK